jgi:hypothetical protein
MSEQVSKFAQIHITRRSALAGMLVSASIAPTPSRAQEKTPLRIGVLNDQSGPFPDLSG